MNRAAPLALLLVGAACSDRGFTQLTQEDLFQQNRRNTVDVLLVVDNSCSMIEEQAKLATNFESFIQYFDDADVDWQIGVITTDTVQDKFMGRLIGGDDEIILRDAEGRVVDQVEYDKTWPVGPGAVFSLDPSYATGIENDDPAAWCISTPASPGEANPGCGGTGEGTDPTYGEVLVTEFVPDPDGVDDALGEWVEVTNISDTAVDLTGWTLGDAGRNAWSFPDGTTLAPGEALALVRSDDPAVNGGIDGLALGEDFTLNNNVLFLTPETEGASEIFAEMVAQGTSGSGIEMGLEAARLALTEPLLSGENAGFLREDANLSILVVSDEEDSSPLSVPDYLNTFVGIKGEAAYRDHQLFNLSGVVGHQQPEFEGEPSCSSASGYADYGSRYVYAAAHTGGLLDSICDEDFSPIVEKLGLTLSGLQVEFTLSRVPEIETLTVTLYADRTEESMIRELVRDTDYLYVEETNSIRFEYPNIPESQQYILAEYTIQSGG